MFVSFSLASAPMKAWFYDKDTKNLAGRPVLGWSLSDSGNPEAVILVPNAGVGVRVSQLSNFVVLLAADTQPTDITAIDEVFAGITRAVNKDAAEEWKNSVTGVSSAKSAIASENVQPTAQA